jgi:hypothetical protein
MRKVICDFCGAELGEDRKKEAMKVKIERTEADGHPTVFLDMDCCNECRIRISKVLGKMVKR